jgi:hypothetical protein
VSEKPVCCGRTLDVKGMPWDRCSNPPAVERNGKWYCSRHDPVAYAERCKARVRTPQAEVKGK